MKPICFILLLSLIGIFSKLQAQNNWQLTLESVRVDQQRESGGDRPYFNTIYFRSKIGKRGSTKVELRSREPNDWVSKREYNNGRLSRGDHMSNRETLNIPFWMGQHEWRNVNLLPIAEATKGEVFGAIIISMDNNNMPPHAVRNVLDKVAGLIQQILRSEVETSRILLSVAGGGSIIDEDEIMEMALNMISAQDVIDLLLQYTVGSTFNPDHITGIQAYVFPTVEGIPEIDTSGTFSLERGPIRWSAHVGSPQLFNQSVSYEGSGARYRVITRMRNETCSSNQTNRLEFMVRTGNDNLDKGSRLSATVHFNNGNAAITREMVSNQVELKDRTDTRFYFSLGRSIPVNTIKSVALNFTPNRNAFGTDNWKMEALTVRYLGTRSGYLFMDQGRPLHFFTAANRTYSKSTLCGVNYQLSRTVSPGTFRPMTGMSPVSPSAPADPIITSLSMEFTTGGDDLRGGNDNLNATLYFTNGSPIARQNLNQGKKWNNNSKHTIEFRLDRPMALSKLKRIGLEATVNGGWNGDNWNMDRLKITAKGTNFSKVIYENKGYPLHRFSGDKKGFSAAFY